MFRMRLYLFALVLCLFLPAVALSAHHEGSSAGHQGMDMKEHSMHDHAAMGHDSMAGMTSLGECVRDGIKASAMIKAYDAEAIEGMKVMGMEGTHHLMIHFFNVENGMKITDGLVAVKLKETEEAETAPLKLMPMAEGFGADVVMSNRGDYELVFGTKLKDGKKRQFEFFYLNP